MFEVAMENPSTSIGILKYIIWFLKHEDTGI